MNPNQLDAVMRHPSAQLVEGATPSESFANMLATQDKDLVVYTSEYPNLNDAMTPELQEDFRRYMQFGEGLVEVTDDGVSITFPDQPISVQSVVEACRLRQEREINLGS